MGAFFASNTYAAQPYDQPLQDTIFTLERPGFGSQPDQLLQILGNPSSTDAITFVKVFLGRITGQAAPTGTTSIRVINAGVQTITDCEIVGTSGSVVGLHNLTVGEYNALPADTVAPFIFSTNFPLILGNQYSLSVRVTNIGDRLLVGFQNSEVFGATDDFCQNSAGTFNKPNADLSFQVLTAAPPPPININISAPAENDILDNQSVAWEFVYAAPGTQTDIVITIEKNSLIVQSRQFELFATERTDDTHVITRAWIVPATGILEATARLLDCSGPTLPCTVLATSTPRTFTISGIAPPGLPEETLPDALNFYQENAPTFLGPNPTPTIIYTSITSFISAIMRIPLGIANGFGDWTANVTDTDDIASFGASIGIILAYQGAFNDLFGSLPVFQALFLVLTVLFGVGVYKLLRTALQLIRG